MFLHRPLFPGSDRKYNSWLQYIRTNSIFFIQTSFSIDVNQLNRILDVVGFPSSSLISQINDDAKSYLERNPKRPTRVDFATHFHEIKSPLGNFS